MQRGDKTAQQRVHAVPGRFAAMLLDELAAAGGDADGLLASLRLPYTRAALARGRVPLLAERDFVALYRECITQLSAQANRERDLPPMRKDEVDLLCHCVITCRTLDEVIARAARFCAMLGERAAVLSLERSGDRAVFHMATARLRDSASGLLTDLNGLSFYHRLFAWLIGERIPVERFHVFAGEAVERELLESFFGRRIEFGCADNHFAFPAALLDRPVTRSPGQLEELLAVFPFDQMRDPADAASLAQSVEQLIATQLARSGQPPSLAQCASLFNLSPATFRRRLQDEGLTLGALKQRQRQALAVELLDPARRLKLAEVARRLGFGDARAFRRAFVDWTGSTPDAFRRAQAAPVAARTPRRARRGDAA